MNLSEGDRFDHYQIRVHVAQGGTGDVYRAFDLQTGREVALKVPMRSVILDAARYEQFLREVEAMRSLQHPSVQQGLESGRFDNTPFLVTEWVEGKSLRQLLKENGSFPVERVIALTRRIAEGLAYCHQQNVVHRDVKPENILIQDGDQPVILDFGLALTTTRPGAGKPSGTPDYVAPEQIEGRRGDQRIDLYALGAVFYEMLAGEAPFTGADHLEVMRKHLGAALPRLDQVRPDVSPQVAAIAVRCLQRDPGQRYPNAQALINDLDHPDQVDVGQLARLTAAPPKPSFLKTQAGQVILLLTLSVVGIALLTLVAVTIRH